MSARPFNGAAMRAIDDDATAPAQRSSKRRSSRLASPEGIEDATGRLLSQGEFLEHLTAALDHSEGRVGIIYIELDRLRSVYAALGYQSGDAVVTQAVARLEAIVGSPVPISSFVGDALVIGLEKIEKAAELYSVAERVRWELSAPFSSESGPIALTASVGIAFGDADTASAASLLQEAGCAAECAGEAGGNRVESFEPRMQVRALTRIRGDAALREALERSEFRLHYQPAYSLSGDGEFGIEALIRWIPTERRTVMPMNFIPLAEETGFIVTLGAWVFKEACTQLARWQREGEVAPSWLSVNLSARQLYVQQSIESFEEALESTGADPSHIVLEITESALMDETPLLWQGLDRLRSLGIQLSIDDFGTRYSSLTYLRRFHFDQLKIDRSFVAGLDSQPRDQTIVKNVIALAHGLGLSVVVEGIQTPGQLKKSRAYGADWGQGYHLSPPVPADLLAKAVQSDPVPYKVLTASRRPRSDGLRS